MPKDLSGAQVGMAPKNNINNPRPNNIRGRNEFPQTHKHLTTERYGEYSPSFWAKCERGDVQNLQPQHDLHTFTMSSPMVSTVDMTKSFVKVPMQAIYPRQWERMMTIPTQGSDVPADTRALLDVRKLVDNIINYISDQNFGFGLITRLVLLESITSHGSLFEKFNMHLNYKFRYNGVGYSPDKFFDLHVYPKIISYAKDHALSDYLDREVYVSHDEKSSSYVIDNGSYTVSARQFIHMLRQQQLFDSGLWDSFTLDSSDITVFSGYDSSSDSLDSFARYLNIEPILSYQLACAQFGTNDHVDFIYSAQLYRENMQSLYDNAVGESLPSFLYNGVRCIYDVFSARILSTLINIVADSDSAVSYFQNLFSYVPALRYGDYFTGGKPRPLAVGEYSANVVNDQVSAIDVTRSIQMQRLLNRVNMVGRKLGDYLSGIFGGKLPEAPKDVPVFLAHQRFNVDGFEVNNTGSAQLDADQQNITTTNLRAAENRFAFEVEIDEPCYIICLVSYETMRIYSRTMDRFAFHHDRYDDFIPEMQYIGDQDIMLVELDSTERSLAPFAYALRYMEYKQRYSYASGGFIENLPSWAFITDNSDGTPPDNNINPDYIRSSPSEFDRFYKSLSGYSLGSYFHFIVAHTNITSPARMMEYTPEILK